jgi:hypothetical protein
MVLPLFEGRVRLMTELSWLWSVTDPDLAGRPGSTNTHGELPLVSQVLDLHPASDAVAASSLAPNRKSLAGWRRTGGAGSS